MLEKIRPGGEALCVAKDSLHAPAPVFSIGKHPFPNISSDAGGHIATTFGGAQL